ncbi:sensor histidine kinase [Deinococcus lacus]|uniref:Sensor histidine kinase n=1 Tax=Deinococcus lacus TaxID=392561 RepID=A0ABW1YFY5_9DEIO
MSRWLPSLIPLTFLVFLAFPVGAFLNTPRSLAESGQFWSGVAVFLAAFGLWLSPSPSPLRPLLSFGGALLAYALTVGVVGFAASAFPIYAASFGADQTNGRRAAPLVAACVGLLLLGPGGALAQLPNAFFAVLGALGNYGLAGQREAALALERAQAEQERLAADAERERIARDLHDLLGHTLSVIVLKSELAGKLVQKNPERAAEEIREVERISREALTEVRAAVRGYRGSGFASELARAKVALDTAGIRLSITDALPPLPEGLESTLAMVLREGVTNVVRHSGARELRLSLRQERGGYALVLHDDGRGGHAPKARA